MCEAHLGETIDIHAGGNDLMFPHHENEVAQSTCAHGGKVFARWWLHNGMLTFGGRKMSKSLGNTLVLHELLERHPAELLRYMLMKAHYRQPLDWSDSALDQAQRTLDGLYGILRDLADVAVGPDETRLPDDIVAALADDLNTPEALAIVARLGDGARKATNPQDKKAAKAALLGAGAFLGLLGQDPEAWFKRARAGAVDTGWIERLIAERAEARKRRDYAASDRIRDELLAAGVAIEDGPQGARWKLVAKPADECPA
jgi:cysteinyl-tRNA synthetase